jgi:hypothetical protein
MLKCVIKCLCVFCTRQERKQAFKACYEKGRAKCRAQAGALKWQHRREQLEGSAAHD